jgi:hypothetical protein
MHLLYEDFVIMPEGAVPLTQYRGVTMLGIY